MRASHKYLCAICIAFLFPQKVEAGILEGALIGAGVGAVVGVVMSLGDPGPGAGVAADPDSSFLADSVQFGKAFRFAFVEDSGASLTVKYNYGKIFSDYETYAKEKKVVSDTVTANLIGKALWDKGGDRVSDSAADVDYLVRYKQLLGWDMGEIVKRMTICVEARKVDSSSVRPVCVEFSEMTMFNTHPTRARIVKKLVALLAGNDTAKDLNSKKFRRFVLEPSAH